jgi:hypothetical protein
MAGRDPDNDSQTTLVNKFFSHGFIQRFVLFNIPLSAFNRHQKLVLRDKKEFSLVFLCAMLYSGSILE